MLDRRMAWFVTMALLVVMPGQTLRAALHGDALFARHCAACHGHAGKGGVGVPLSLPSFIDSVPDAYLRKTIRAGRDGRIMPAFETLSDAQVDAIVAYMGRWRNRPAPQENTATIKGDAGHGAVIFRSHCAQCHGEEGRGGQGTGVTFSRKRNLPIMAPALNNAGFLFAATDTMIRDTILFGRQGTPMTSMLVDGLSEQDIDDVVAYIRSFETAAQQRREARDAIIDEPAVITAQSPYGMKETIENLKQAITDQNFTLIRVDYLDHGLVPPGQEDRSKVIVHFCNFRFLYEALAIDPRVGMFLPCKVTLTERDGKVQLSTINPKRLSRLFNNHELDASCDTMRQVYQSLLEDATL